VTDQEYEYPRNLFMGSAVIAEEQEMEAQDQLKRTIEGLEMRLDALSRVLAEYALTISEQRVRIVELEKKFGQPPSQPIEVT
jgi:hypothetical protein